MSSSRAKEEMNPSSHLKSTQQELKASVVDRTARGDSNKSTAKPMKEMKEKNVDSSVERGGDKSEGATGLKK